MQIAPRWSAQTTTTAPAHHKPVPAQPEVGSIFYTRHDGSVREFGIRPYIHEPGDFPERYGSISDAARAVAQHNRELLGVAFGVFQASEGAFAIRPLESENGLPFLIDGPDFPARTALGSALDGSSLVAIVGWSSWIDLSDPAHRTRQPVTPLAGAPAARAAAFAHQPSPA